MNERQLRKLIKEELSDVSNTFRVGRNRALDIYENEDIELELDEDEDIELELDEDEDAELNEDSNYNSEYQMDIVFRLALKNIRQQYSEWEEDSYDNYGEPIESANNDDFDDFPSKVEWSTRGAKIELLNDILKVLNLASKNDDIITIN